MTATPTYGFQIGGKPQALAKMQGKQAGGKTGVKQGVLVKSFPNFKYGTPIEGLGELEEVDKPEETVSATSTPATSVVSDAAKEETTASLYNDYMASMPGGVRELVTTDYKGVRGGRLGAGNYSTASIIPGAQVSTPAPAAPAAPAQTGGGTTYNAPVVGGNWEQYYGDYYAGDVNYGTIGYGTAAPAAAPAAAQTGGLTPAWAKKPSQQAKTTSKAGGGMVPSTASYGSYVAPSSAQAPATAQRASQVVQERISSGSGQGAKGAAAAAGDPGKMGSNAAAALISEGGRSSAQAALKQAEKGNIELSNQARKALEDAAKKNKDKDKKKK